MRASLLLLSMIMIALAIVVDGKGMWGSRRKKDKKEDSDDIASANIDLSGQMNMNKRPGKSQRMAPGGVGSDGSVGSVGSEMEETIRMYLDLADQYLSGPEFDQFVTPQSIQNMISMIPADALENPDVAAMIKSPELANPEILKMNLRQGLQQVRLYASQIAALIDAGPEAIDEAISQAIPGIPMETRQMILALMKGDTSELAAMVEAQPGMDESQKAMVLAMLRGDESGMEAMKEMFNSKIQEALGDTSGYEESRLQFLESPEAAHALGITDEQLNDPNKWAELMQGSMKDLQSLLDNDDNSEDAIRKFAASGAA